MTTRRMRSEPTLTKNTARHAQADCVTCGRSWSNPNALAPAAVHARSHGHVVTAPAVVEVIYDGSDGGQE